MVDNHVTCVSCNEASNSDIESYCIAPRASFANAAVPLYFGPCLQLTA